MSEAEHIADRRDLARARAYSLLGKLLRRGLSQADLDVLGEIGELARVMRVPYDADAEAAAHYALFGHEVFPFEGVFRDAQGTVGGAATAAVITSYEAAGFAPDWASDGPDHVGHELAFLGYLSWVEWQFRTGGTGGDIETLQDRQRRFLDAHLLGWLPPLAVAVRMRADRFWVAVLELALNLALAHRAELARPVSLERRGGGTCGRAQPGVPRGQTQSGAPAARLLDDPSTSLSDVARHLLIPARSGLHLSCGDISAMARGLALPRGFGPRQTLLTTLLRAAVDYERLGDLLAALEAHVVEWEAVLAEYRCLWPTAAPHLSPWTARLAATRELLGALGLGAVERLTSARS